MFILQVLIVVSLIDQYSFRTDTQLRLTWHFTVLGISFCLLVSQPIAFLVLERNYLGDY